MKSYEQRQRQRTRESTVHKALEFLQNGSAPTRKLREQWPRLPIKEMETKVWIRYVGEDWFITEMGRDIIK